MIGSCIGIFVLQPLAIPVAPLTNTIGISGTSVVGNVFLPSSYSYYINASSRSSILNISLVYFSNFVNIYLELAADETSVLFPNYPSGNNNDRLFNVKLFYAIFTIAFCSDISP